MLGWISSSLCRPVCIWFSARWSLSVVYIERTKAMSSTHVARWGHQSLISIPLWPCLRNPTWSGKIRGNSSRFFELSERERSSRRGSIRGLGCGVSANVFPAYLFSAGFGSKVSR